MCGASTERRITFFGTRQRTCGQVYNKPARTACVVSIAVVATRFDTWAVEKEEPFAA